jgi:hypothetical protein
VREALRLEEHPLTALELTLALVDRRARWPRTTHTGCIGKRACVLEGAAPRCFRVSTEEPHGVVEPAVGISGSTWQFR